MMAASRIRAVQRLSQSLRPAQRTFASTARQLEARTSVAEDHAAGLPESKQPAPAAEAVPQAPNRVGIWSRSQKPRAQAMTGPRFEQTDFALQPQAHAAIELIHKQPVHWTHEKIVSCDGGGGPHGHPRIFINTDKPEIATCGYCGLPFAHEHHRKHLEALPETSYPLA